jgi:ArsR family transcriptional regulator
VRDRREGTWSFHSLAEPQDDGPLTKQMYAAAIEPWLSSEEGKRDLAALVRVLEQRREKSRSAHDLLAERWESGQDFAQGSLRSEVMAMAWPSSFVVADLGCGTGFLSSQLAPFAKRVIAVDHSPRMLEAAQKKALPRNCEFRQGELDALPIEDESVDAAFANLVWHHLPDLQAAAREVFRILKAGGAVVISDLLPHESEWMRDAMGDLRLGLKPEQVVAALAAAGFHSLRWERAGDRYRTKPPEGGQLDLPMFLVRGQKPIA